MSNVTVDTTSQFKHLVKTFWDDRVGFSKHIIGFTPSDQQGQVLEALDSNDHVAVKSGIAIGKTALEASLILHYSSCRYPFKSPCTSPSKDNLRNILWPELGQWHKKMHPIFRDRLVWTKEKLFLKEDENSFFVARTASKDNPESLQGFHSDYVMRIVDEASGVSEDIFDVLEGATGTKETKSLTCGNPTRLEGSFFDAFGKQKDFYTGFTFSSLQSPFAKDRVIERIRKKFGEDSNMWRIRVLGEFPLRNGDSFIPFDLADSALTREIPDQKDAPKVFGCDIARYGCFDDQTEILTDEGWKHFEALHGREKVLSLAGEAVVWAGIAKVHKYGFDGYLNLYEGESINFCITDNHNLIVRSNPKAGQYAIKQFRELPKEFVIKRTNTWEATNPERTVFISEYEMPNGGMRIKEWTFDFVDWAKFLGWFVSEGSVYKEKRKDGRYRIMIAQVKAQEKDMIKQLLCKMGIRFQDKGRQIEFSNNEIGKHLVEYCGGRQPERRVPKYIKEGSSEAIKAFLETFALGDGTRNSSGAGKTYFSSSELLIDDIQEMLAKIGKAGKKAIKKQSAEFEIEGRTVKRRNNCWVVYERSKEADAWLLKKNIQKVPYKGFVYCVSTPHRTIMVRRNGCVMWSGNSDDTVIAIRQGDEFKPFHVLKNKSTMEVAGFIAYLANREKPRAIFIDVIGIGCFDDKTEILTKNGWQRFSDLEKGIPLLTMDPETFEAEYRVPDKYFSYPYEGEMYSFEGQTTSFCITPNHNLFFKGIRCKSWSLEQVQNIKINQIQVPRRFVWKGEERGDFVLPDVTKLRPSLVKGTNRAETGNHEMREYSEPERHVMMDAWLEFLGWFLSEGYSYERKNIYLVGITQSTKSKKPLIRQTLDRLGFHYREKVLKSGESQFEMASKQLYEHVKQFGQKATIKRIPDYVKQLSPRQIRIFLDAYMLGDGGIHKGMKNYRTSSRLMADDLQELVLKAGGYASVSRRKVNETEFYIGGRIARRTADTYVVQEWIKPVDIQLKTRELEKVYYKGSVYCVEVNPYHLIYVRRNGKCMWSGNSGVYDRLEELGFPVIPVNVSETPALEPRKYRRLRDELWGQMRDWLETRRGKIWDNEEGDLVGQLTTPKYRVLDSSGVIVVESKDDMKKRGVASPNVADACILTFAQPISSYQKDIEELYGHEEEGAYAPMDAEAGY